MLIRRIAGPTGAKVRSGQGPARAAAIE